MIVYADILIILNMLVDYFLLLSTASFVGKKPKLWRMLLGAFLGGVFSLYIFLPQSPIIIEFIIRIIFCSIISFCVFGFLNLKAFLKVVGVFFGVNCLYAGLISAIWKIFKPKGLVINNSVVYFDISALTLIVSTVIFYFLFIFLSRFFASNGKMSEKCFITLLAEGNKSSFTAIIDTGNSVSDIFGNSEVIIVDKAVLYQLFSETEIMNEGIKNRYRVIPINTVSGGDVLEGYRCDYAELIRDKEKIYLKNPIIAISKTSFSEDYIGIVNPKIFRNVGEENVTKTQTVAK